MKIEWAPVHVPPRRRLQTFAAGLYVFIIFLLPLSSLLTVAALLIYANIWIKFLTVGYLQYVFFDHRYRNSVIDGNGFSFIRKRGLFRSFREYFPVELKKTVDLSPNRNYIIASFPHGVLGTGITINMGNDISKWTELFPGIRPKIATLDMHFYTPILREILRLWGFVSVSKESLLSYLEKSNDPKHPDNRDGYTSNAIGVLVGGAQEALDSHPGRYVITLKSRKGFVKVAILSGSPIVPSISFGEVDIWDQVDNPPDSWLRFIQSWTKKFTGVSPVIMLGRGFFQYTIGVLPQRKPIVQVLGAPIEVEKSNAPDPKYVEEIHQKFMNDLTELFETHKSKYLENADKIKLEII